MNGSLLGQDEALMTQGEVRYHRDAERPVQLSLTKGECALIARQLAASGEPYNLVAPVIERMNMAMRFLNGRDSMYRAEQYAQKEDYGRFSAAEKLPREHGD